MGPALDPERQIPSRRHDRGRSHMAAVINHWLGLSSLSHDQVAAITDWALRESGYLGSSQLSHLRNAKVTRPGLMLFEALSALNAAIWRWQSQGEARCIEEYGPFSSHGIQPEWLTDAVWLPHPDHPADPLCFGDFVELFAGYLTLPDVAVKLSQFDGPDLSRRLSALLLEHWQTAGWGPGEGMAKILEAYPNDDAEARTRLTMLTLGQADWTSEEFEAEIPELAALVERLRSLPTGSYGPPELHAELTSARRRA